MNTKETLEANYAPTEHIRIPVNKKTVLKNKIVKEKDADKIVDFITEMAEVSEKKVTREVLLAEPSSETSGKPKKSKSKKAPTKKASAKKTSAKSTPKKAKK